MPLKVIQLAELAAVQEHPLAAVTRTFPAAPLVEKNDDTGAST
ncbi:MAG: hypothetical protein WKF37_05670 [Bryobacteraceae bacterium]